MEKQIKIGGKDFLLQRLALGDWCKLEEVKKEIDDAVSKDDYELVFTKMVKFIETALRHSGLDWNIPWFEFVEIYSKVTAENSPTKDFPILRSVQGDNKKLPWEYDGRSWYFWLNLFAKNYGWKSDEIYQMDIDDAIGLYQELAINDQLEKEFYYGLSEVAYPYNSGTKKSEYKPMPRPNWMLPIVPKQLPIIRMKKDHLPLGNVIDLQAQESERLAKRKSA